MNEKPYELMTEEELAEARIALDERIAALRAEKKAIQDEVDKRRAADGGLPGHTIANAGGIESKEEIGKV